MQDLVGQQLGNYQLLQLIGWGGYADVYLGKHVRLDSQAALKVLHTRLVSGEEIDKFQNEGRIVARLIHPHIIRVLDFDVKQDIPFMVMDYAPNGTLRKRHPRGEQLELALILTYVKQVADALQYAHDQHYVHRDIKPENMLLGRNDEVLLSDFGTALISQATTGYLSTVQEVVGTVSYMAPEQFQGKARPASDQYALAVVVYEWLCGSAPFLGSGTEVAIQHSLAPPPPLLDRVRGMPPMIEQIILRALAKDYHERYPRVQDFAAALEQASQVGRSFYSEPTIAVPLPREQAQTGIPRELPAVHTVHPPMRVAPLATDTVTSQAAHMAATPVPQLVRNMPLAPPQQGAATYQAGRRRRGPRPALLLMLLALLILLVGGLAWLIAPPAKRGPTTPTPAGGSQYPHVAGSYSGSLIDVPVNISASMSLSIEQDQASISGDFRVGAPLKGSNPFKGRVTTGRGISFTVERYQGNAPLSFTGSIHADGSLAGSYCSLAANGQCSSRAGGSGTWQVARA